MKLKEIFVLTQKEFEIQAMLTHFSHEHFKVCCVCMYAFFPEVQQAETSSPILIHIHTTESSVLGQNVTFLAILAAKDTHKKNYSKGHCTAHMAGHSGCKIVWTLCTYAEHSGKITTKC